LYVELAAAAGFAASNTQNTQRSRVWRSTAGTSQYVRGTFADGLARTVSFFGFFLHRCHGGKVRLQLYSDTAWTTQVYDSTALDVINVVPSDGANWGIDPYGGGAIDPFLLDAPYWLWLTATACKSYKITFSNNVTTYTGTAYWQVCRFYVGKWIEVQINPDYGLPLGYESLNDRNRTRGGSLRTNVGQRWRQMTVDLANVRENERAAWLDIANYCGTGRDFVISLFPEEASRRERDHMLNGKFSALGPIVRQNFSQLRQNLRIEEV
jgi:hypothetical protein